MANIVQWQDLFVIIDDGRVSIREYQGVEPLLRAQAKNYANGPACLVIIPEKAVPPPSAVREHLEGMLGRLQVRALAYVVEGTGFRAATARAALIGLGIFQRKRYPTNVFTTLGSALDSLLEVPREARTAMKVIQEARTSSDGAQNRAAVNMARGMGR